MPRNSRPRKRHRHSRSHVREMARIKRSSRLRGRDRSPYWLRDTVDLGELYPNDFEHTHTFRSWLRGRWQEQAFTDEEMATLAKILDLDSQLSTTAILSEQQIKALGRRFAQPRGQARWMGIKAGELARLDQRLSYYRFCHEPDWSIFECEGPTRSAEKARVAKVIFDQDELRAEGRPHAVHTINRNWRGRYLGIDK